MEFEETGVTTIQLTIPNEETFKQLVELTELPECTLEVAETRHICDTYLDTPTLGLLDQGMDCRLSEVDQHHFLIFNEIKAQGKFLKAASEHVERLNPDDYQAEIQGKRSHPLYTTISKYASGELVPKLVRRATFASRLFKVGESRFELGLESIAYERDGKDATEQLVSLDIIQGDPDVIEAIAQFLKDKFELEFVSDKPFERGMRLTA